MGSGSLLILIAAGKIARKKEEGGKVGLRDETGTSAFILAEYIDALVAGEEPNEEEFLRHAAPADFEALRELFKLARELKDLYSHEYVPDASTKERIWQEIERCLKS